MRELSAKELLELSAVSREDMAQFDHKDDWNVPCLYIHEAQTLVHQKVMAVLSAMNLETVTEK